MLEFLLIAQIALFCTCAGFCWVCLLTTPNGLFSAVTCKYKHLSKFTQHVLQCVPCLSGWLALCAATAAAVIAFIAQLHAGTPAVQIAGAVVLVLWDGLRCCLLAMTGGKIIQSFTER